MENLRFKFRAWIKDYELMADVIFLNIDYKEVVVMIGETDYEFNCGEYELMQYTGLKDKNGKEIYEGDILEAVHKLKTQKFNRKYQVIFNEKGYWDAISLDDKPVRLCYAGFDKCEVIGNIFQDGDLLRDS